MRRLGLALGMALAAGALAVWVVGGMLVAPSLRLISPPTGLPVDEASIESPNGSLPGRSRPTRRVGLSF